MPNAEVLRALSSWGDDAPAGPARPSHWELVTAPVGEPVSTDQVRRWIRQSASDATIEGVDGDLVAHVFIPAARRAVEAYLGQVLLTQTWDAWFRAYGLGDTLELDKAPLQSVTSVTGYDDDGTATVQGSTTYYTVTGQPAEVALVSGNTWPSALRALNALKVRFVAGYGASAIGPELYKATAAVGTGNYAITVGGTYTGSRSVSLRIACDGTTSFKISTDGGVTYRHVATTITGGYQLIDEGLYVLFPATTGYATTDYWTVALTGHGVPEHYQTAIAMTAAHLYLGRAGRSNETANDLIEKARLPPTVCTLLGPRVLL